MRTLLLLACLASLAVYIPAAHGWSAAGHKITGALAQALLSSSANAYVVQVLPTNRNGSLMQAATWADEIKSDSSWKWSAPLHYIDTPDGMCSYVHSRDCRDAATGDQDACVSGAITNYTTILLNHVPQTPSDLQTDALMFLDHFIGDIHQPLHVGFTSDLGGNLINVTYNGTVTNLHSVWDYFIVQSRINRDFGGDMNQYINYLLGRIQTGYDGMVATWKACNTGVCPDDWALESVAFACNSSYANITNGGTISDEYYSRAIVVVDARLAAGGVRLAAAIEYISQNLDDQDRINVIVGSVMGSILGVALVILVIGSVTVAVRRRRQRVAYAPL